MNEGKDTTLRKDVEEAKIKLAEMGANGDIEEWSILTLMVIHNCSRWDAEKIFMMYR